MIATVHSSYLHGSLNAPAGKSAMQRACALALLTKGETIIHNPGLSNDDLTALDIIVQLGAEVKKEIDKVTVKSSGKINANSVVNCGESGLSFRMFAPIAALDNKTILLTGSGTLLKRPMHFIDEVFPSLNVSTKSGNGFLPISITGPLQPTNISIDASLSSQYLTGLLFAFAAASTQKPVTIEVFNLKSKPYIDLSLQMLAQFGFDVTHDHYKLFHINPVTQKESTIFYYTESDWSSASFLMVGAAIAGEVVFKGLSAESAQADKAIIDVLRMSNASVTIQSNTITVNNSKPLNAFEFDATDCPDLFPPLVALAAYCEGTSVIKGVSRLFSKESNRADSLVDVFIKMKVQLSVKEDTMYITGNTGVYEAVVSSHHDHRIAMAAAVAGLKATGSIRIHSAEAINKSYPGFYNDLKMLGADVSLQNESNIQ